MNIMASMMLTYSWLTFIHMPLFTKRAVICTQTSTRHIKIFDPEGSSPSTVC